MSRLLRKASEPRNSSASRTPNPAAHRAASVSLEAVPWHLDALEVGGDEERGDAEALAQVEARLEVVEVRPPLFTLREE